MSDYSGIGDAFAGIFRFMFVLLCIFVPLGVWKMVEIIIYVSHHLHWSWG